MGTEAKYDPATMRNLREGDWIQDPNPTAGPWEAMHHPKGSWVKPVDSHLSILAVSDGTPCMTAANAELIADAVNWYRVNPPPPGWDGRTKPTES